MLIVLIGSSQDGSQQSYVNLATAAKLMMKSAQLLALRGSCPRGHMQAVWSLLSALSHLDHEPMTVKRTYSSGYERRGHV